MPPLTDTEQRARMRYKAAFVAPVISLRENRAKLTTGNVRAINNFIPAQAARIVLARKRLEMKIARSMIRVYTERAGMLFAYLEKSGLAQQWINETVRLYTALHKPGESIEQTQRAIKQELKQDTTVMYNVGERLRNANEDSHAQLERMVAPLYIGSALFAEDGVLWGRKQMQFLDTNNKQNGAQRTSKATAATVFNEEDAIFAALTFETGSEMRLLTAYADRGKAFIDPKNKLTVQGFTPKMFSSLQDTLQTELFEKGNGMREQASVLWKSLATKYGSKLPSDASNRIELWVRTEGATVQNDALMAIGKEADMDGKRWDSVGDALVRPAHQDNTSAGVIPVKDNFPDGSSDAGSGSQSPYQCRCASGPALLDKKYKVPSKPANITIIPDKPGDKLPDVPGAVSSSPSTIKPKALKNVPPKVVQAPQKTTIPAMLSKDKLIKEISKYTEHKKMKDADKAWERVMNATAKAKGVSRARMVEDVDDVLSKAYGIYASEGYSDINRALRGGNLTLPKSAEARFKKEWGTSSKAVIQELLDDMRQHSYALPENTILYRGLGDTFGKQLHKQFKKNPNDMIGMVLTDKGFVSTTIQKNVADSFVWAANEETAVRLKILASKGTHVLPMSKSEVEYVLAPNTKFVVQSVKHIMDKSSGAPVLDIVAMLLA